MTDQPSTTSSPDDFADTAELLAALAELHLDEETTGGRHTAQILASLSEPTRADLAALVVYGADAALQVLARDPSPQVRAAAASNQAIYFGPDATMLTLARDVAPVALALATNIVTGDDDIIQGALARHTDRDVRLAVLHNDPPPTVAHQLRNDPDADVRRKALELLS